MSNYRICSKCIMDTSDPNLVFNEEGVCSYCMNYENNILPNWRSDISNSSKILALSKSIKKSTPTDEFNCIIGLSGGLDSSYVTYVATEVMELKPLIVHVDAGWNTEQSVGNIAKIIDGLGLDLYTEVVNWEAVKRMQLAFLRSGIPDQDLVQDAAFFSVLYKLARRYKIKHIITGSNFSTECCREPIEWGGYLGIDKALFNDIWLKCGDGKPIKDFPIIDILVYKILYQRILNMKVNHPLNLISFVKETAEQELHSKFGWQPFVHKHHESRFTRFYEDYWLPRRFGFEKRKAHFSSLIQTGQMTRKEALKRIAKPEMSEHFLSQEFEYVASKLDISNDELKELFEAPKRSYAEFRNKLKIIKLGANFLRAVGLERRHFN